jgi:hypothetical protein
MDESYSLLIGLDNSSDCDRWSVVEESYSDAEIRHGQQDNWTEPGFFPSTGEFQNDKVSDEEIELYHQLCISRAAVKHVTQAVLSRYQIYWALQPSSAVLFPNETSSISVSPDLPERYMFSKLSLIKS